MPQGQAISPEMIKISSGALSCPYEAFAGLLRPAPLLPSHSPPPPSPFFFGLVPNKKREKGRVGGERGKKEKKISTGYSHRKNLTKNFLFDKFLMPLAGVSEVGERGMTLTKVVLFSML